MRQFCLYCEREAADHNLYCQETYCPAEMSPTLLETAEWLGDIEIVRPIIILRSSVLYEAVHQQRTVLLKIAHPGPRHKERLKREAEFLRDLRLSRHDATHLPRLLPPYSNATLSQTSDPYGKMMVRGHLLYFALFEYFPGEPLRDLLLRTPQLWLNHAGWIVIQVAEAVAYLHSKGTFHFGLSPEAILIYLDAKSNAPHILLFELGIVSDPKSMANDWYRDFMPPAYLAPEFISVNHIPLNYRSDVYGLGLLLYELLVGEPAVPHKLLSDAEVYRNVQDPRRWTPLNRMEDVRAVADIARQAVQPQIEARQAGVSEFAKQLEALLGRVPVAGKSYWPSLSTIIFFSAALLAIAFIATVALTISQ